MPSELDNEDTDTAFNKLRESDDSPELETPKPVASVKTTSKKASSKKKPVRSSPPLKFRFEKKVNHFTKFI